MANNNYKNNQNDQMAKKGTVEYCILCGKSTEYTLETPIDFRDGYIEDVGQLCRKCYSDIYKNNNN